MAERFPGDGAAANGFGRRWLSDWEARLLYEAGYPAPPDFRAPTGGWALSVGGVPIPPVPEGADIVPEIQAVIAGLTEEERELPQYDPGNYQAWAQYFQARRTRELAAYEGPPPPPKRKNAAGRQRWWSVPGRTLAAVLEHIHAGNTPALTYPPATPTFSRRRGSSWFPRRMASRSSSSSAAASASRSSGSGQGTPLLPVKPEPASPSRTRSRGIFITPRASPPANQGRTVRPKTEEGTSSVLRQPKKEPVWAPTEAYAEEELGDEQALAAAMAASLNDVIPMALPDALAWSRAEHEKEEAERRARLQERAARRQRRAHPGVIILDPSDDEDAGPSQPQRRQGDAGQGSSRGPKPPSDDEDDGDYTVMYSQFGMQ